MNNVLKRCFSAVIVAALAFSFLCFIHPGEARAEVAFDDYPKDGVVFDTYIDDDGDLSYEHDIALHISENTEEIEKLETSNKNVAYAIFNAFDSRTYIIIYPMGPGTCKIKATGKDGGIKSIPVKVTEAYVKAWVKHDTHFEDHWYGTNKISVYTVPGAKVTLKIGKDKLKAVKADSDGLAAIKIKKTYPLDSKLKATVQYKGVKITEKDKIYPATNVLLAQVKPKAPKKVKLQIFNLHKGDVVKVKYKGKTYSKKIKKNYNGDNKWITVKVGRNFKANSKMRVWVVNKDKKLLTGKDLIQLDNWSYDYYGEDDEGEYYDEDYYEEEY